MPEGFCPPFQCQSGIIAKSTMHHAKAIADPDLLGLVRRLPPDPWRGIEPGMRVECALADLIAAGCTGRLRDFPQAPAGVEEEHDDEASAEEEKDVVEQALAERHCVLASGYIGRVLHNAPARRNDRMTASGSRAYCHERSCRHDRRHMGLAGFVEESMRAAAQAAFRSFR